MAPSTSAPSCDSGEIGESFEYPGIVERECGADILVAGRCGKPPEADNRLYSSRLRRAGQGEPPSLGTDGNTHVLKRIDKNSVVTADLVL